MTGLTKKDRPNIIKGWQDHHDKALKTFNNRLKSSPILRFPVFQNGIPFILRTGAADTGPGAVMLQKFDGEGKLPFVYTTCKKLLPRENIYSVIEKECLDIIWAIGKFRKYMFGTEFLL